MLLIIQINFILQTECGKFPMENIYLLIIDSKQVDRIFIPDSNGPTSRTVKIKSAFKLIGFSN